MKTVQLEEKVTLLFNVQSSYTLKKINLKPTGKALTL